MSVWDEFPAQGKHVTFSLMLLPLPLSVTSHWACAAVKKIAIPAQNNSAMRLSLVDMGMGKQSLCADGVTIKHEVLPGLDSMAG